jgi:hypothetical protein
MDADRPVLHGRFVQVDVCAREAGVVLSVGPVSLWLPTNTALDVVETLARALALEARADAAS